jgi:hypothetical protein
MKHKLLQKLETKLFLTFNPTFLSPAEKNCAGLLLLWGGGSRNRCKKLETELFVSFSSTFLEPVGKSYNCLIFSGGAESSTAPTNSKRNIF